MVQVTANVHPKGLGPKEAAKAWYMRTQQKLKWNVIRTKVKNLQGRSPESEHAVKNAVKRVAEAGRNGVANTRWSNSGRRYGPNGEKNMLTKAQEAQVIAFVKKWRHKFFCTGPYIKLELKLDASERTIRRTLNRHGFYWRTVAKKTPLTEKQLAERKVSPSA